MTAEVAQLLEVLQFEPDEQVSVCMVNLNGEFESLGGRPVREVPGLVSSLAHLDCWVGANPIRPGIVRPRRGYAVDVIALRSLYADVDVKQPKGMPSWTKARAVVDEVSSMLGVQPVAIVMSGHGLQPRWLIEQGPGTDWTGPTDPAALAARALNRRFGRLVQHVAGIHGGAADGVYDVSRVLRAPATTNHKSTPVLTTLELPGGAPVSLERIVEVLDEYGIREFPEDGEDIDIGELVSLPATWRYGTRTCNYVGQMVNGWATAEPTGRHPWLVGQAVRLAAAQRQGCITEPDYRTAVEKLAARFRTRLNVGDKRQEARGEISGALAWGRAKVATLPDERTAAELGTHKHPVPTSAAAPFGVVSTNVHTPVSPIGDTEVMTKAEARALTDSIKATMHDVAAASAQLSTAVDSSPAGVLPTGNTPEAAAVVPYSPFAAVTTLADVVAERLEWLWPGRFPKGKLVVFDGDPSVGKSTLSVDFAARVSTGTPWPDGTPCPVGNVLILSAEDGLADTIRPRLDAAGGDPTRVHALTGVRTVDEDGVTAVRSITLDDIDVIAAAIRKHSVALLVVDVLMAYLPTKVDSHRDQHIRTVLARLSEIAGELGCTIILLRHLNKTSGGNPMYRGGGSIGIVGAARAGFVAAIDPDDEKRRVLACTKSNLAAMPESLAYELVSADNGVARVQWHGTSTATARTLLDIPGSSEERTERDEAVDWLTGYLEDKAGQVHAADAIKAAAREGISKTTLTRARERAGIVSRKTAMNGPWIWEYDPRRIHEGPEEPGPTGLRPSGSSGFFVRPETPR